MHDNLDVCVVVPTYNEASVVGEVIDGVRGVFPRVVCVDDGSTDASGEVARTAGATVIRHSENLGAGAAMQTGLMYALGLPDCDYVVTFDADGQHRVGDARDMLAVARRGEADIVLGSRFLDKQAVGMPASRRALLRGAATFTKLTSRVALTDPHIGLRVMNRHAASKFDITLNGMAHASQVIDQIVRHGLRWVEHPVTVDYTPYSRSKGQRNINAINVSLEVLGSRLRASR